jgi:hypothetical protein
MAAKIDLYKLHRDDYVTPKKPALVTIGKARYLTVRGRGAPGGDAFGAAIGALYGAAYTIKMTRKFAGLQDYAVCKLEGQYFIEAGRTPAEVPPDRWEWRLMIRTPGSVKDRDLRDAAATLKARGKGDGLENVHLESIAEGTCVQMLHVGPYDQEEKTLEAMRAFAEQKGYEFRGPHHEIYLSDPRRVPPERLKTILREPLAKA